MSLQIIGIILSVVLGFAGTSVSTLVLFNLRSMIRRIETLEAENKLLNKQKTSCQNDFVSKEDWLRGEGITRDQLAKLTEILNRMDGKLTVTEKLPQIAGEIAKSVATEIINKLPENANG
jgi:hypothetical protein